MIKQQQLWDLFTKWRKDCGQKGKFFACDGIVSGMENPETVLFIGAEPNVGCEEKKDACGGLPCSNCKMHAFWFKIHVYPLFYCRNMKRHEKGAITKYHNRVRDVLACLPGKKPVDLKRSVYNLAYMNLNKRGGGSTTDRDSFIQEVNKDRSRIKEEIEIIDPDIIVVFGRHAGNAFLEQIAKEVPERSNEKQIRYLGIPHLCYSGFNEKLKKAKGEQKELIQSALCVALK